MHRLYDELAEWWPLVSNPAEYVPEVDFFLPLLAELTAGAEASLASWKRRMSAGRTCELLRSKLSPGP